MSSANIAAQGGVYTYTLGNKLYLNITNRCSNHCEFCVRETANGVKEGSLWLTEEPSAEEVLQTIVNPKQYKEIVFCGFGEPLSRLEIVVEIASALKTYGVPLRINTNGQANLMYGTNVVPRLAGLIDCISISLNADNSNKYQELCHSKYGEEAFPAVLEFTALSVEAFPRVIMSVVARPDIDVEACRKIALQLGAEFKVRVWSPIV